MTGQTSNHKPLYGLHPTWNIGGYDSLAQLALDMRTGWDHSGDHLWERLDPARSPLPWLQRVTINLCYSRVSRRKTLAEPITSLITNLVVDLAARPDQVVESREVLEVLQRGIDALPPKQQTAIILYYLHGYSLAEAAEIADCNVGTMKSRLHYALKALRVRLPVERRVPVGGVAPARVTNR